MISLLNVSNQLYGESPLVLASGGLVCVKTVCFGVAVVSFQSFNVLLHLKPCDGFLFRYQLVSMLKQGCSGSYSFL